MGQAEDHRGAVYAVLSQKVVAVEDTTLVHHQESGEVLFVGLYAAVEDIETVDVGCNLGGYSSHIAQSAVGNLFGRKGGVFALY